MFTGMLQKLDGGTLRRKKNALPSEACLGGVDLTIFNIFNQDWMR